MHPTLPLNDLANRHSGLTPAIAANYLEAARICLDRHHQSPQKFALAVENSSKIIQVKWESTDDRCKAAWANHDDATRDGAYACALAATELSKGLVAVRRAETKTGADYYVAPSDEDLEDLENWFRLEVSGLDSGNTAEVRRRLTLKAKQVRGGNSNLPALAAVVGFKSKSIMLKSVS
jgi:hypothetical protein